jgi:hypothetical protein
LTRRRPNTTSRSPTERLTSPRRTARFAVDFALGAVEEAEYAVLYATLAGMGAEEMTAGSRS